MFFKKKQDTEIVQQVEEEKPDLEQMATDVRKNATRVDKKYLEVVNKLIDDNTLIDYNTKDFTPRAKEVLQSYHNFGENYPLEARYLAELEVLMVVNGVLTEHSGIILFFKSEAMRNFVEQLGMTKDALGLPADEIKKLIERDKFITTTDVRILASFYHKDLMEIMSEDLYELHKKKYNTTVEVEEFICTWTEVFGLMGYRFALLNLFLSMIQTTYRDEYKKFKTLKSVIVTNEHYVELIKDFLIPFYIGLNRTHNNPDDLAVINSSVDYLLAVYTEYDTMTYDPEAGNRFCNSIPVDYYRFRNRVIRIDVKEEAIPEVIKEYHGTGYLGLITFARDRILDLLTEITPCVKLISHSGAIAPSEVERSNLLRDALEKRLHTLGKILHENRDINYVILNTRYFVLHSQLYAQEWFRKTFTRKVNLILDPKERGKLNTSAHILSRAYEFFADKDERLFINFTTGSSKQPDKVGTAEKIDGLRDILLVLRPLMNTDKIVVCLFAESADRFFRDGNEDDPEFSDLVFNLDLVELPKEIADYYDVEETTVDKLGAYLTAYKNRSKPYYKELLPALGIDQGDIASKSKNKSLDKTYEVNLLNLPGTSVKELLEGCKRTVKHKDFKRLTILASGESGTGKTMLASYLAKELGLTLVTISGSDISSKWVGESEQNVKKLFLSAGKDKLLLIEEADNLMGDRDEAGTKKWDRALTNEWLVQLERFEGVLMVTTNYKDVLDKALLRRFTVKIEFKELKEEKIEQAIMTFVKKYRMKHDTTVKENLQRLKGLRLGDLGNVENLILFYKINKLSKFIDYLEEEIKQRKSDEKEVGFTSRK